MKPGTLGGLLLLSTIVLPAVAFADEVFLVGGGRIVGEVVEERGDAVVIEVGAGRVTLPASRVVRVTSGASALSVYRDRAARLGPSGRRRLAGARLVGAGQRPDHARRATPSSAPLAADPGNEAAHRALGHVRLDGQWMTESESYRARGYVQYEGEWMTPEQAQMLAAQRMAEVEARRAQARGRRPRRGGGSASRAPPKRTPRERPPRPRRRRTAAFPIRYVFGGGYTPYSPYGAVTSARVPIRRRGHGGGRRGRDGHRGDVRQPAGPTRDDGATRPAPAPRSDNRRPPEPIGGAEPEPAASATRLAVSP